MALGLCLVKLGKAALACHVLRSTIVGLSAAWALAVAKHMNSTAKTGLLRKFDIGIAPELLGLWQHVEGLATGTGIDHNRIKTISEA